MPTRVLLVHDETLPEVLVERVCALLGPRTTMMPIAANEKAKSVRTLETLWKTMADERMDRASAVVALGGGIISDIAGFAAATYSRGVRFVVLPTTVLAMVDAAIGGKTAVNMLRPDGTLIKNMIGSVWVPELVISDVTTLATLPVRDIRSGLAECIKHAMLSSHALADWIVIQRARLDRADSVAMTELVRRSAPVKIDVVVRDPLERRERMTLNLGHTYAHAIESLSSEQWTHGEAVAIGLVAATAAAVEAEIAPATLLERVKGWLTAVGLPTQLAIGADIEALTRAMGSDKKREGELLRLILPLGAGGAQILRGPPAEVVRAGWESVAL